MQAACVLSERRRMMPDPILVGRDPTRSPALAQAIQHRARWGTDLDRKALLNPDDTVFFDAGTTQMRGPSCWKGDRCRQACLLREADRDRSGRSRRR
jgi:hypothetical protein